MAGDSSEAVVKALVAVLLADSAVSAIVGARVYDRSDSGDTFPLITIGDETGGPWDGVNLDGNELFILFNGWSKQDGHSLEARQLKAAMVNALHDITLTVAGHSAVYCRVQDARVLMGDDANDRIANAAVRVEVVTHI